MSSEPFSRVSLLLQPVKPIHTYSFTLDFLGKMCLSTDFFFRTQRTAHETREVVILCLEQNLIFFASCIFSILVLYSKNEKEEKKNTVSTLVIYTK